VAGAACLLIVLFAVLIFLANQNPWLYALMAAVIVVWIIVALAKRRQNKIDSIEAFKMQARELQGLANRLIAGASNDSASFALKPGEILLGRSEGVGLLEWVSTGSSYQGGSQGVSIRVMRGVSYRVGSSRGQLVKNPPALKTLDVGTVTYTSKRITFSGMQETRQWDVEK